jgi:hypothetical protein
VRRTKLDERSRFDILAADPHRQIGRGFLDQLQRALQLLTRRRAGRIGKNGLVDDGRDRC